MGCNVTSIYGDEVIGKIYYPDQILTDLRKRDFCQPFQIKDKKHIKQISQNISSIYGFSQSFCQGFVFSTVIDLQQFLVYNNGRFVVKILKNDLLNTKTSTSQPQMSILPHEDQICAMDVNQNMCVVGLSGGKLLLWDLKFNQVKIQIYLPKPSSSFSSISLTKKYIFVTDTNLPNNIAYCFDIQTTKIKSSAIIDSIEPTLKGIRFQENQHAVISAEGVWFMKYLSKEQRLSLTKGMFLTFPKTSQCSITSINDKYLVSGGVDGYIYVWNSIYQCIKVIKCFERQQPITAIVYNKEHSTLIMGTMEGKIKCFSFSIKLKPKKTQEQPTQNDQPDKEQDIEYLLTQALDEQFGVQNLVTIHQETLVYLALNCRGSMTSHLLPSHQPYPLKIKHLTNHEIIRFSRKGDAILSMSSNDPPEQKSGELIGQNFISPIFMINVYPKGISEFNIDRLKTTDNKRWLTVESKSQIKTKERNKKYLNFYSYCKTHSSVAYTAENWICVDFQPIKQSGFSLKQQLQASKQFQERKNLQILQLLPQNVMIGLNYLQVQHGSNKVGNSNGRLVYLLVTFEDECNVFEVRNKTEYIFHTNIKFAKNKFSNFTIHSHLHSQQPKSQIKSNLSKPPSPTQETHQLLQQIQTEVEFNYELNVWQLCKPIHQNNIQPQITEKQHHSAQTHVSLSSILNKVHCSYLKTSLQSKNALITIGGSSLIFWHSQPGQLQ